MDHSLALHFTFHFAIYLNESYLVPRHRRSTYKSRTSLSTINFCWVDPLGLPHLSTIKKINHCNQIFANFGQTSFRGLTLSRMETVQWYAGRYFFVRKNTQKISKKMSSKKIKKHLKINECSKKHKKVIFKSIIRNTKINNHFTDIF